AWQNLAAGATDTALVPAVSGKRIRVLAFGLFPSGTTPAASTTFNSKGGGAGTAISPAIGHAAGVPVLWDGSDGRAGLFETNPGEALTVSAGAGTNPTGVMVVYEERV